MLWLNSYLDTQLTPFLRSKASPYLQVHGEGMGPASLARLFSLQSFPHPQVVLLPTQKEAREMQDYLRFFGYQPPSGTDGPHFFPAFENSPYSGLYPNPKHTGERLRTLFEALASSKSPKLQQGVFLVTVASLCQKLCLWRCCESTPLTLRVGEDIPPAFNEKLEQLGYFAAPFVEDPGQWAMRGGIIDIFPFVYQQPARLRLKGNCVESLRSFSTSEQQSLQKLEQLHIIPCREIILNEKFCEQAIENLVEDRHKRQIPHLLLQPFLTKIQRQQVFPSLDYLLPFFYTSASDTREKTEASSPLATFLDYFERCSIWVLFPEQVQRVAQR